MVEGIQSNTDVDVLEIDKEEIMLGEEVGDQVNEILNEDILVTIEGQEYSPDTKRISITGQITSEIEEALLTLPDLTEIFAHSAKEIPATLTGLTHLYANYALVIPATLTNLVELYANSVTELPDTLVNLRRLHAHSILVIPDTYKDLKFLYAASIALIPEYLNRAATKFTYCS